MNLLFGCGGLGVGVFLLETLDAASSVHELLLAGEKWVAIRANFDAQHVTFNGGASLKSMTASAMYGDGVIVGMNSWLHDSPF
jgi:hypothetical protein